MFATLLLVSDPHPLVLQTFLSGAHSADGLFTIKSTYGLLYEDEEHEDSDFSFNLVWKI